MADTENKDPKIEPGADTDKQGEKKPDPPADDKAVKKPDADAEKGDDEAKAEEKRKAAEARRIEREAQKLAEQRFKEMKDAAEREAAEKAELAKKTETERLEAEKRKLQEKLDAASAEAEAAKRERDLALELNDQGLSPAGTSAREYIAAAFAKQIKAGKDPADALKAVAEAEPFLFKQKVAPTQDGKPKPKGTEPASKGPTQNQRVTPPATTDKQPGEAASFAELQEIVQKKHGIRLVAGR